jgi:hypothetical protein
VRHTVLEVVEDRHIAAEGRRRTVAVLEEEERRRIAVEEEDRPIENHMSAMNQ